MEGNRRRHRLARLGTRLVEFQAIHDYYKETDLPILLFCEILDASRSRYYKGLNKEIFKEHEEYIFTRTNH